MLTNFERDRIVELQDDMQKLKTVVLVGGNEMLDESCHCLAVFVPDQIFQVIRSNSGATNSNYKLFSKKQRKSNVIIELSV